MILQLTDTAQLDRILGNAFDGGTQAISAAPDVNFAFRGAAAMPKSTSVGFDFATLAR